MSDTMDIADKDKVVERIQTEEARPQLLHSLSTGNEGV